jgi:hypothetical protein
MGLWCLTVVFVISSSSMGFSGDFVVFFGAR